MNSGEFLKKFNRRKFFVNTGLAAVGFAVLNSLPVKAFTKARDKKSGIKISEHPSAVKRIK